MRGLAFGGWGHGLALGKRRRRTLMELGYLKRQLRQAPTEKPEDQPFGCICDDRQCAVCAPEPEPAEAGEEKEDGNLD